MSKNRKIWPKILIISASAFALIIVIAALFVWGTLRRGLPQIKGVLEVPGLTGQVIVTRDEEGVPHIQAENEYDLFFAQGFVQAQDRLFQMDLSRRQASGRLSEVFGEMAIDTDKRFRTLGLRRSAEESWPIYSPDAAAILEAFADGVNAFIKMNENKLSVEFFLNGYKPEPWTPVDTLTIGKYMSYDLAGHWQNVAFRQYLLENFTEAEALELFPENTYLQSAPLILNSPIIISREFLRDDKREFNGSNNWVIAGERTASGKPLVSDDPHLAMSSPSVWYQMHLQGGRFNVSGVIFGGVPGIILGHNEHVAWGVTNSGPQVQDLFIEKINPDNPLQYLFKDEWLDIIEIPEPIYIKGGGVEEFSVLTTHHGPIISELAQPGNSTFVYSMQWTALQPSAEIEGMLNFNRATDWQSFEKALEKFDSPMQNFVFACVNGTIAYKANGKIPIRDNGGTGLLPAPGWDGNHEWIGYVPFNELPRVVNPPEGFIATANNKIIGDDYPHFLSHDWAQPHRQQRILEFLKGRNNLTPEDMRALQGDVLDLHAREIVPIFLFGLTGAQLTNRQQKAVDILAEWDYEFTIKQAGPLIFALMYENLNEYIFDDRIDENILPLFFQRENILDSLLRKQLNGISSLWIEYKGGFEAVLLAALELALDEIEEAQGKNMDKWQWGAFHQVEFAHPLSSVSILRPIFSKSGLQPSPGTKTTVRSADWKRTGLNFHGASWRYTYDFSTPEFSYQIVAPGQSGHPLSPYYHKQFYRWINGEQYKTYFIGFSGNVLTLKPAK